MGEPRSGKLTLEPIAAAEFLAFAHKYSFDPVDKSRIKSQYADALTRGEPDVGVIGVRGCGELIGAISWGAVRLPRADAVSARLDVVVTAPHCRGLGLARLLVAAFVTGMVDKFGSKIEHFSVIAVHPAVAHIVESLGFVNANMGASSPIFHRPVDEQGRLRVVQDASSQLARKMGGLRQDCARCLWRKAQPWCREVRP
jgi:GNAT superfamily N-acetyltransferase